MQLKQSLVLLALVSVSYASPAPPSPSPVVSIDVKAKLEAINAEIVANSNSNATSSLAKRSVHCQTSAGSPYTPNAQSAAAYLQGLGTQSCCQTNNDGSYCTTMWTYGTAAVGICSDPGYGACDTCIDAGNGLYDVANSCSVSGIGPLPLSGGWADIGSNSHLRLILFHS